MIFSTLNCQLRQSQLYLATPQADAGCLQRLLHLPVVQFLHVTFVARLIDLKVVLGQPGSV